MKERGIERERKRERGGKSVIEREIEKKCDREGNREKV